MKFYPNISISKLSNELNELLIQIRKYRGFNLEIYLESKSFVIKKYFEDSKLDSAVIAVSGGVDSALALALICYTKEKYPNVIKKIVPITLPLLNNHGATNQNESINKAYDLCSVFNLPLSVCPINESFNAIQENIEKDLDKGSPWARGQLTAYARTPFIYYTTSVLSSQGFRSVVIGTTNRDEGAYLGYVGKASDGIVDVQIISDLHKSEVFSLAKYLGVPDSILNAVPAGDMYDNRVDEEVFGAPYDFVELYLNYLNLNKETKDKLVSNLPQEAKQEFEQLKNNLEELHSFNKHKYGVGSVAIHLDVLDSAVVGGWIDGVHSGKYKKTPKDTIVFTDKFVGFTKNKPENIEFNYSTKSTVTNPIPTLNIVNNFLTDSSLNKFRKFIQKNEDCLTKTNEYGLVDNGSLGSERISFYSEELANKLLESIRFKGLLDIIKNKNISCLSNYGDGSIFRVKSINPMFRVLKYNEGTKLVAHYDDAFVKNEYERSLVTLLIGLDCADNGGETQFILNEQDFKDYSQRDFSDLPDTLDKVSYSYKIQPGDLIFFDHRIQHQSKLIESGVKFIVRTEIIYERCD